MGPASFEQVSLGRQPATQNYKLPHLKFVSSLSLGCQLQALRRRHFVCPRTLTFQIKVRAAIQSKQALCVSVGMCRVSAGAP